MGRTIEFSSKQARSRQGVARFAWLLACIAALQACDRAAPAPDLETELQAGLREGADPRRRALAAAVTIRFANGRLEPGGGVAGSDRLQVAAVFGDVDRRDVTLVGDLVGQATAPTLPSTDACVRQPGLLHRFDVQPSSAPHAYVQLLDVGNLELRAGSLVLPLRVQLVPSLFAAARGVRYDADQDMGRHWLAAGPLHLIATGGDGIAPFDAVVAVPRPVRLTYVGSEPVRAGRVQGPVKGQDLLLRWGSIDGAADLEMQVGAEVDGGLGWLRCRLRDDGAFSIPAALIEQLPTRTADRPWLAVLLRSRRAAIAGFDGTPLRLELTDAAHIY